ncbi:30S ribosomal protein S20 [Candidatus Microgenomates bacterium]|nr:30S ribosomal protein S20 [Candidatus Microgenomates bacterium]
MPVTKTAKRALRGSKRKKIVNDRTVANLESSVRKAKETKTQKAISKASSYADRAVKDNIIHKNKAARIKKQLSLLLRIKKTTPKK